MSADDRFTKHSQLASAVAERAEEHECDEDGRVDTDLCAECGEHAGFCSVCGASNCCGAGSPYLD